MIKVFFTFLKIVVLFGGSVPGKRSLNKRLTLTKLWVSKYVLTKIIRFSTLKYTMMTMFFLRVNFHLVKIYSNNAFIQNDDKSQKRKKYLDHGTSLNTCSKKSCRQKPGRSQENIVLVQEALEENPTTITSRVNGFTLYC